MNYHFGRFRLDAASYRLLRDEAVVSLSAKLVDLLIYFVTHPGRLVTKEELFGAIWPDVTVTDNALTQAISDLRHALGDDPSASQYIQTVARRGYRFVAPVTMDEVSPKAPEVHASSHETSSLEAYRAYTEGRLKLETLDRARIQEAMVDFERALSHDPLYPLAFTGLAASHFLLYEASRPRTQPDAGLLTRAIGYARRAADLAPELGEAHAMLAFMLVSADRPQEALAAGRRAVALEPNDWRHQFRLGHAAWGEERLQALDRALRLFPDLPFAHFEIAMVRIARGEIHEAEGVLREGVLVLGRHRRQSWRFPASGLHWLLGTVLLARGARDEAQGEFEAELAGANPATIYGAEFVMNAYDGLGFAHLDGRDVDAALEAFDRSLDLYPDHARAVVGRTLAFRGAGDRARADAEAARARQTIDALQRGGRRTESSIMEAALGLLDDHLTDATAILLRLLNDSPPGFAGWMIPVDPLLGALRRSDAAAAVFARLAERAR